MHNFIFSDKDKVQFFEVIKDINEHLHHVKQYDKLEDVLRYAQRFEKEMVELARLYEEFLDKKPEQQENKKTLLEEIINVFREKKNWEAVRNRLIETNILSSLEENNEEREDRNRLEEMWQKWKELTIEFDIIIQKITEIQVDRSRYFNLLEKQLGQVNQNINNLKFELRQKLTILDNLLEEEIEIYSEDNEMPLKDKENKDKETKEKILQLLSVFIDIRSKMNNLQIERNKMKGIAPIYPAFVHNLQQPISVPIRGNELRPKEEVITLWEEIREKREVKTSNDESTSSNKINKEHNFWFTCDTEQKRNIALRATTILNRLKKSELNELNNKLQKLNINTWDELSESLINLQKEDSNDRISFTRTSLSNNLIEEANFHYLLKLLRTEGYKIFEDVCPNELKIEQQASFSKLKSFKGEDLWEQVKIVEVILNSKEVDYASLFNQLIKAINEKKVDQSEDQRFIQTIKDELAYYIRCTKEHAKIFNNRVFSDLPTQYEPYEIKNTVFQHQLKDKGFLFSSKFRKILKQIDNFLENSFFDYLLTAPNLNGSPAKKEYQKMYDYIKRKLESLRIGQYDVLNEYLHSQKFIAATDRIQLYSGSFGIWNEEAEELVRLQDRRYCQMEYRPLSQDANKWFDLNDRIFDGEHWKANIFEESIDLMFLTVKDRTQIYPEFYRNLSADNNFLNKIEKDNNCVFCEDGEISAFTLLYRFLNTIFHSKLTQKDEKTNNGNEFLDTILAANIKNIPDLNRQLNTSNKIGIYSKKTDSTKRLARAILYFHKPNILLGDIINVMNSMGNEHVPIETKKKLSERQVIQYFNEDEKEELGNVDFKNRFKKQEIKSPYLFFFFLELVKKINDCNYRIRFDTEDQKNNKPDALELKVWKYLLLEFIKGLLECWNEEHCLFQFEQKGLPRDVSKDAYNDHEATARREKFYNDIHHRIPEKVKTLLTDLTTQGLLDKDNKAREKEDRWDTSYLKVTERYINLCKFIDREFNESKRSLKVKCNFDPQLSPVSPDRYFIDTKIEEIDHNEHAKQYRINEIRTLLSSIKNVVEDNYSLKKIAKSDITNQLAQILNITLESVTPFLCSKNFQDKYKSVLDEKNKDNIKKGVALIWSEVKDRIDEISKFPISPWFVWRANGFHALSHLVLPIASTAIKPESPNTGFLIMGLRNVIEDHKGRIVHITNETEEYFTELIYTIRSIFQPLIHPFMDKIYYGQIINKTVQDNAVRAGVARVMSRNLSHNIGSHVLEKLARLPINKPNLNKQIIEKGNDKKEDKESKIDLEDFKAFTAYLRTRMALIADISTGKPYISVPAKLRNGILTEFQKKIEFAKDSFKDNKNYQKILLKYISGEFEMTDENMIQIQLDDSLDDIDFALPNSQMGAHALYVILENIIRNAFKHSDTKKLSEHKLKLTLEYDKLKDNEKLYKLSIIDNLGAITSNRNSKLLSELQEYIDQPITDPKTRKLQLKYWGMVEMKIAAAYLRQLDVVAIDETQLQKAKYPLLEVGYEEETITKDNVEEAIVKNLRYDLYLQVPMLLEIIYWDMELPINSELQKKWLNHGIKITKKETKEIKDNTYLPATNYPFQLFIYEGGERNPIDTWSININTHRIVSFKNSEAKGILGLLKEGPEKNTLNDVLSITWNDRKEKLLEENKYNNQVPICIFDSPKKLKINNKSISNKEHISNRDLISNRKYDYNEIIKKKYTQIQKGDKQIQKDDSFLCNHIFFSDHDKLINHFRSKKTTDILYYEAYGSVDPTNFLLKEIKNFKTFGKERKYILDEIIESAFTDIGILDERIQIDIDNYQESPNEKRSRAALERVKVFVPKKPRALGNPEPEPETDSKNNPEPETDAVIKIDLQKVNKNEGSEYEQKIRIWIDRISEINRDKRPLDFLVIHIRIIEKLVGTKKESIDNFIKKLKKPYSYYIGEEEEICDAFKGQVIITSGRGVPNNIPPDVPFLAFAVLGRFLFEQPSKFTLTKLLFTATMKGGIHE